MSAPERKQQLHHLIDQLDETDLVAALRYLQFLLAQEPPVEPDMLARIDAARKRPLAGIPHEDLMREYGL
ncbi:MAG TPA: hypothetical protein VN428_24070 [Bryobacteraceae bacterium]|nr:hypothetical protein [Bryobacteraceae bacterium]